MNQWLKITKYEIVSVPSSIIFRVSEGLDNEESIVWAIYGVTDIEKHTELYAGTEEQCKQYMQILGQYLCGDRKLISICDIPKFIVPPPAIGDTIKEGGDE